MASQYTLAPLLAVAKTRATNLWVEIDITAMPLKTIFSTYRFIEVGLLDAFQAPKTLHLIEYEFDLLNREGTLQQWLTSLDNRALSLTDGHPTLTFNKVHYYPAEYHHATMQAAKAGYHPSQDVAVDEYNDLVLTYPNIASADAAKYHLYSVNGFYFISKYQDYGVRLVDASDTVRATGKMEVGYLDFTTVGEIKYVPITKNRINKVDPERTWFDTVIVDVGESLSNKTVGIVIGGYLHLLDGLIRVNSDTTFTFSMRNHQYLSRVLNSLDALSLTELGLDDADLGVNVSEVYNEEKILAYLTSKYSFVVLIDNPEISVETAGVAYNAMAGTYITKDSNLLGRLTDQTGRSIDYWPTWECGQWALKTSTYDLPTRSFTTADWQRQGKVSNASIPIRPTERLSLTMHHYYSRRK